MAAASPAKPKKERKKKPKKPKDENDWDAESDATEYETESEDEVEIPSGPAEKQLKAQMDTDGADDQGEAASPSKAKAAAEKKKKAANIQYEDEFESFHLSTQEKCEELCAIVIEKLEEAGKKGHMRGCETRFALKLAIALGSNLTMKDLEDLQKKLAIAKKQKKVEAAEKANRAGCNEAKHAKMVTNVNSAQAHLDERYAYDDDDYSDEEGAAGAVVGEYDENGDYVEGMYKGSQWVETKRYKAGTFDAADFA